MANEVKEFPVLWLQGATCSGCSVSILNAIAPDIANVLLDQLVPGVHLNLRFHPTVMAGQGDPVIRVLAGTAEAKKGEYVLVVEGAVPCADHGEFATIGEEDGREVTFLERVETLSKDALAIVALGTCASYGGVFSAAPNPTGCKGVMEVLAEKGIATPVVNVPGCAPHPDWFVGTVAYVLVNGLPGPDDVDEVGRLKLFYGGLVHENCPRRPDFDAGRFAKKFGDPGCLYELGCKGPEASADCPTRQWNRGVNWCIGNGSPCHACVEPDFPDKVSPLYRKVTENELDRFKVVTK